MGDKMAGKVHAKYRGVGIPSVHRKRMCPFLEYVWKRVSCHSNDKRPTGPYQTASQQQGTETAKGDEGPISWLPLFAVLQHRLWAVMRPWDCFSGTEKCQCWYSAMMLSCREGLGPRTAGFFKICCFEFQPLDRYKTERWCWVCQGLATDRLKTGIWRKPGTQAFL